MSLLFNMLSRLAITFLPRSKCFLISWLQSPAAVILEPPKIKSDTVHISRVLVMLGCQILVKHFTLGGLVWGAWQSSLKISPHRSSHRYKIFVMKIFIFETKSREYVTIQIFCNFSSTLIVSPFKSPCCMHQKLQFQTEIFHPGSNPHLGWQLAESNEACLNQENALYTYKVN